MKKIFITTLLMIFAIVNYHSQCNIQASICTSGTSPNFNFVPTGGAYAGGSFANAGCATGSGGNHSYGFITLYITQSGPLNLLVNGSATTGYIDVAIFNIPSGQDPCVAIQNGANAIGCNFATNAGGCVQFGTTFGCNSSVPAPNVTAGQQVMIIAQNWSNASTSFNLQLGPPPGAQTGPFNATINPPPALTTTGGNYTFTGVSGGGTWSSSCGGCINSSTGVFNPATAGPGVHQVCYAGGTSPCNGSSCVNVTVTTPCTLTATASGTNVTCNGAANGSASVTTNGANAPYTYSWSNGGTGASISNLPPGTYTVTVTSTALTGCSATSSYTVTQPTAVNITTTPTAATCAGNNGSVATTVTGGTAPYSYSWNTTPVQTTANASNLAPGNYTLTVSTPGPCTYTSNVTVGQTGSVTSTFNYNGNQCLAGNNVVFTNTGTAVATHNWNFGNGQTSTAVSPSHVYAAPGTYTVTHTVTSGTCTSTTTQNVTIFPMPTSTITGVNPLCNGGNTGSVNLTPANGTTPYSFAWSNGAITEDINNLTAGTYNVTISDNNGCQTTNTFTLNNPPALTNTMAGVNASCQGVCNGTATATPNGGTAPYTYLWNNGQTGQTATGLCAGNYTVVITDANGCTSNGAQTINNATVLTATTSTGNANCGTATGSASVTPAGGTTPYNYLWTPNGQATQTINLVTSGNYGVTVTDNNGCVVNATANVLDNAGPTVTIPSTTNVSCFGGSNGTATAAGVGGTGALTYAWTPSGGTAATGTGLSATTTYTVTVTDNVGCQATANTSVTQPTQITVGTNATSSNCGQADGSVTATGNGGTGALGYSWENAGGTVVGTTASVSNLVAGSYTVTVTDVNGCSETANATISDISSGSITVAGTNVTCNGVCNGTATATVTGGTLPITYSWSSGAIGASASNLCAGNFTVTAIDGVGCVLSTSIVITEPDLLVASITNSDDVSCFGSTDGTATANANGGTAPYTYSWNSTPIQTTQTATNLAPGGYTVTVTDNNNCQSTQIVTINEPAQIILSGTDVDAHCNLPDGSATVNVTSGGVAPFSYTWSTSPSTTATASNIAPGTINVIVTDNNGCNNNINITVGNIPAGTATITNIENPLCNNECNGTASVSMAGTGTSPYTYLWSNGNTNQNAIGFCDGAISVTVTDANGCVSTANANMVEPNVLDVLVVITQQPSCFGVCDGSLQGQVTGGTGPFTYLWSDPLSQASVNATGLCGDGTTYSVTIVDANGCQVTKGSFLTEPSQVVINTTSTDASCGQSDGEACATVSGGTGPYNVVWPFDGSSGLCLSNIPSNTYIVNATDANGCPAQTTVTVSDLSGPSAAITSQINVTCFGGNDGSATALITGGVAPYNYLWDANAANQTTPTASNLVQGTYTLTITDQNGCIASTSVTITQPDDFVVQGLTTNPTCFGYTDGQIAVTLTGGTAPYTYAWNDPANQTTAIASGLGDGSYTIVITDAVGCNTFAQYNLFDPLQFVGFANNTSLLCNSVCDGTATATFNNNNGAVTYVWDDANTQTTALASGLCAGTYQVTLTDNAGCIATATTTITEPTTLTGTIDLVGNVSCNGLCDGFANANISGGTAPYTFSWSNGSANPTATNLCAGNYSVDVTDANGCQITLNTTITQPTPLNGTMTNNNVTCYGLQNGQATFSVGGGVAPYTYQWNDLNFQTTASATNVFAGNYMVTVTDANACVITENVAITQPNQIAANVNITNSNCGQNNGNVCVNISGGVLPYQFVWNDPNQQTSACAVNILAGTYTVTVTDNNNCVFDTILNINDILGPTVTFNDLTDPSCNGLTDGEINMTVAGGTLPYATYSWDNNGTVVGNNNPSLTNIGDGCYTLTVIDDAGCVAANSQCLFEPNGLNSAITSTQNVTCNLACDGNATVSTAGGTLPHTISWTNGTATSYNGNLCAGTYQATITDANGCQSVSSVTITEPAPLVTSILTEVDVTCFGLTNGQASISVAGGTAPYLHSWNPLVSSSTIATGLAAGGYNIQTTDANGCITNIGVTINSPSELTGTMTVQNATCGDCNGQVTYAPAGGTAPYTYLWANGQTAITATGVCAGNFGGTVIDANGCTYNTLENVVNIAGPVISTVGFVSPSCNGLSNGSATPDFGGGTAPFNYAWSNGQSSQTAVGINAGNYCVTITDANSCVTTSCVNVTQPNQLVSIPDGSTTICFGQETQIWASGAGGTIPYTINWTGGNTSGFVGQGPILVSPTFSQEYCFRVEDANGCLSAISCVPITVTPALNATLPADLFICEGDNYLITGTYTGGSGNPYQYQWYQNTFPSAAIGAGASLEVTPNGVTSYIVELTDGCSTPAYDTIQISLNPNPSVFLNIVNPNECAPGTINFIANSDIGVTFNWDYQCNGTNDLSTANTTASFTYNQPGVYDVCLEVVSAEGCATLVSEVAGVQIYSNPIADFTANPETTTMTNPYVDFTDLSSDAFQWYWDFNGNGNFDDSIQNPSHFYEFPGTYNVGLTVFNAFGCTDYIEIPYTVKPDQNIFVPNAFSPDGDGTNDFFFVGGIGLDVEVFDIYVFNRWGEIIWEGHSPTAQWDGMHKNVPVQTDVYVWQLNTVDINGSPIKMNGHVTVIR